MGDFELQRNQTPKPNFKIARTIFIQYSTVTPFSELLCKLYILLQ